MGAQLVRSVASKTNDIAGDGTTSATVLARAMFGYALHTHHRGATPAPPLTHVLPPPVPTARESSLWLLA